METSPDWRRRFGERLRENRVRTDDGGTRWLDKNQTELGRVFGLTQNRISQIERADADHPIPIGQAVRIADRLGFLGDLAGWLFEDLTAHKSRADEWERRVAQASARVSDIEAATQSLRGLVDPDGFVG